MINNNSYNKLKYKPNNNSLSESNPYYLITALYLKLKFHKPLNKKKYNPYQINYNQLETN